MTDTSAGDGATISGVTVPGTPDTLGAAEPRGPLPVSASIAAERTRMLYDQGGIAFWVNIIVGGGLVWGMVDAVPASVLAPWFGILLLVSASRRLLVRQYRLRAPGPDEQSQWRRYFGVGVVAAGLTWGAAGWLFAPYNSLTHQLIITFVLGGMAVGGIPILSSVYAFFATFAPLVCLPIIVRFLLQWDQLHVLMGFLALVYLGALLATARNYARSIGRVLSLDETNSQLESGLNQAEQAAAVLRERETLLRENQDRLQDFAMLGADVYWELDAALHYTYISGRYEELLGIPRETMLGRARQEEQEKLTVDPQIRRQHARAIEKREPFAGYQFSRERSDGNTLVLQCNGKPLFAADGTFIGYRGMLRDITDQHLMGEKLRYQATHDPLTDLLNRREFERRIQRAIGSARRTDAIHSVCYLDLDQFKIVNDTAGHAAGDEVLRQLTQILSQRLRGRDSLARLGGDEFGILMEHCEVREATQVADEIRRAVESSSFTWQSMEFSLAVSIGLVSMTRDTESVREIMAAADAACYVAKDAGCNRVYVYSGDDSGVTRRHGQTHWAARIRHAIANDQFELVTQPIVPLSGGRGDPGFEYYEALIRLRDEHDQVILPAQFLPAAESYSLMSHVDRWVFDATAKWVSERTSNRESPPTIGVNVSSRSLCDSDFVDHVVDTLRRTGLPGRQFCFEITEIAAAANLSSASEFVRTLGRHGCRFALDDFGAGVASFAYLRNLPVDYIKIDGSFVKELPSSRVDEAIVKAIRDVGRVAEVGTIAECVEDETILAHVRDLGIDFAQGFALGRPQLM